MAEQSTASLQPLGRLVPVCLVILAGVAGIAALDAARTVLAPLVLGLMLGIVLSPAARILERAGVPRWASALAGLLIAAALVLTLVVFFGPVLGYMIQTYPQLIEDLRSWVVYMTQSLRGIENIEGHIAGSGDEAMEEAVPTVVDALWMAPNLLAQMLIAVGALFFWLLTRDDVYDRAGAARARRLRAADRAVSHYFVMITVINACLGAALAFGLSLIGVSNPMVWGIAAFVLNFVLYLGPTMVLVGLLIAGITQFHGAMVLVPPAIFLTLNMIEAQFATPTFVGQQIAVNPLIVFVAIVFGLWLWGPVGGIVALPVLVWVHALIRSAPADG